MTEMEITSLASRMAIKHTGLCLQVGRLYFGHVCLNITWLVKRFGCSTPIGAVESYLKYIFNLWNVCTVFRFVINQAILFIILPMSTILSKYPNTSRTFFACSCSRRAIVLSRNTCPRPSYYNRGNYVCMYVCMYV